MYACKCCDLQNKTLQIQDVTWAQLQDLTWPTGEHLLTVVEAVALVQAQAQVLIIDLKTSPDVGRVGCFLKECKACVC